MFVTAREHPDPRRRRLHVGLRRPVLLQAGEAERHAARLPGLAAPAPRRPRPRRGLSVSDGTASSRRCGTRWRRTCRRATRCISSSGTRAGRAAAREVVRQWWGRDPQLHAGDAQPVEPRRALLPRRPRAHGDHRLLGRHVPELHAQPVLRRRRTSRGEVEVEHWSFLAFAQRLEAAAQRPARDRDPLDRGLVDGGQRRVHDASTRPSARSGSSRRSRPTSRSCTRPSPTDAGNVALAPPLLEGVWGALAARRGAIVTVERDRRRPAAVRSHLVRIPAHRVLAVCEAPLGAHPGRPVRPAACRSTATARTTSSGSRRAPRPAATTTTSGSGTGCSSVDDQDEYLERLGAERDRARCGPRPTPTRGRPTPRRTRPTSTRR